MTDKKTAPATKKATLTAKEKADKRKKHLAKIGLSAVTLNSVTASEFSKATIGEIDLGAAIEVMRGKADEANNGNLTGLEATLTAQATTLDTIFNALARRGNNADTMTKLEIYMRLALKAQAQCARTIEVLATMKNPPVIFAKQANISNGNQQVNNGSLPSNSPAHAGKTINQSNELLDVNHGSTTMDINAATAASRKDKAVATVD